MTKKILNPQIEDENEPTPSLTSNQLDSADDSGTPCDDDGGGGPECDCSDCDDCDDD